MFWARVKSWLKESRMSKNWQTRVVETCVERSLLYASQVRVMVQKRKEEASELD